MSLTYLASPYTPIKGESIEERVSAVCKYAAKLMGNGNCVFSPIAHSHHLANHMDEALRLNHEFWLRQDLAVLQHCDILAVLMLPGWEASRGVKREIDAAQGWNIPIVYLEP